MRQGDVSVRLTLSERDLFVIDAALRFYADTVSEKPDEETVEWVESAQMARGRLMRARQRIGLIFPEDPK